MIELILINEMKIDILIKDFFASLVFIFKLFAKT